MYGECVKCAKQMSCWKSVGVRFGFCETDFEPKEQAHKPQQGMTWKQISSTVWEAKGKYGVFNIKRYKGEWWASYASEDTSYNLPPKESIYEAKLQCEDNSNWEDAV